MKALNSNTPAFQFLCYYKILEGIKKRRQRLIAEAKAAGAEIPKPPLQIVPSDQADFLPWLGDEDTLQHDVIPGATDTVDRVAPRFRQIDSEWSPSD